jgi:mRNA interferase HicA
VCEDGDVTGREFLRRLNRLAKKTEQRVVYQAGSGKGSHGRVFYGSAATILKDPKKELGPGLLGKMCRDLGIRSQDL